MKKKSIILVLLLVSLFVVFLCLRKQADENTIKIGVIMPQTGFLASPGQSVISGINLCIDEFNSKNSDKKIELIFEDSKSDPKIGVSAINKLINVDHVKIVIGDLGSPIFLAMASIAEKNKVVMISPGASNPSVSEAGDYIFRIYTSDEFDGKVMAGYLLDKKSANQVALLHFNNDYGAGLSKAFIKEYTGRNGTLALNYSFDENSLDFKEAIMKLKNSNVKDVYFIGSPKQDAAFLRQIKEANCNVNVYGVLSFEDSEFLNIAKGSFESVEYTTPYFDLQNGDTKMNDFKTKYYNKFKLEPDLNSALGYDVASVLLYALSKCDYKIDELKDQIYKIKDFPSLTGNTTFDSKGDVLKDVMIKEIKGDGSQNLVEIIHVTE